MDLPSIPTDNLYKFMAISGVVAVIVGFSFIYLNSRDLNSELGRIYTESNELSLEIESLNDKDSLLSLEIESLGKEIKRYKIEKDTSIELIDIKNVRQYYSNAENRDLYIFLHQYRNELFPELSKFDEINAKKNLIQDLKLTIKKKKALLKTKQDIWEMENSRINLWQYILVGFAVIGGYVATHGFFLWHRKVQFYLDRELKNEVNKI